jgi:hypothetical protein
MQDFQLQKAAFTQKPAKIQELFDIFVYLA